MTKKYTTSGFAADQFIQFSTYDCERSLPNLIDGLKITQRKVIFGMLKFGESKKIKTSQAASMVAQCLHPDTEVNVNNQKVRVEDLYNNFDSKFDITSYSIANKVEEQDVCSNVFVSGESDTFFEFEMDNGEIFKVTPTHPILTQRGYVNARDITLEDEIVSI